MDPKTGNTHDFQSKVLFLGITSAVTVFNQIMKPIKIFLAGRRNKIVLIANWESREAEIMVTADLGSRGPWMEQDEFQMDFSTYAFLHFK